MPSVVQSYHFLFENQFRFNLFSVVIFYCKFGCLPLPPPTQDDHSITSCLNIHLGWLCFWALTLLYSHSCCCLLALFATGIIESPVYAFLFLLSLLLFWLLFHYWIVLLLWLVLLLKPNPINILCLRSFVWYCIIVFLLLFACSLAPPVVKTKESYYVVAEDTLRLTLFSLVCDWSYQFCLFGCIRNAWVSASCW